MNICFVSQVLGPSSVALLRNVKKNRDQVFVIGSLESDDEWSLNDATIHFSSINVRYRRDSFVSKSVSAVGFFLSAIVSLVNRNFDVILFSTNPPVNVILAVIISFLKKSKIILLIYDLNNKFFGCDGNLKMVHRFWRFLFRYCHHREIMLIASGPKMISRLDCMKIIHNGYVYPSLDMVNLGKEYSDFGLNRSEKRGTKNSNSAMVAYSGNFSANHRSSDIIKLLHSIEGSAFCFEVVGFGEQFAEIEHWVSTLPSPRNIRVSSRLAWPDFISLLMSADIGVVSDCSPPGSQIPSRVFTYLACGIPVLALGRAGSDIEFLISEYEIGISIDLNDLDVIKVRDALRDLYERRDYFRDRISMAFERELSMKAQSKSVEKLIRSYGEV